MSNDQQVEDIGVEDTERRVPGLHRCRRCAGTGRFVTMILNGRPTGPGGPCFRCGGKGCHTQKDRARNLAYDEYSAVRAMRADMAT